MDAGNCLTVQGFKFEQKLINPINISKIIRVPQIISDESAAYISPYQISSPNFVTKKKIIGEGARGYLN